MEMTYEIMGVHPASGEPVTTSTRACTEMDAKSHAQDVGLLNVVVRQAETVPRRGVFPPCLGIGMLNRR